MAYVLQHSKSLECECEGDKGIHIWVACFSAGPNPGQGTPTEIVDLQRALQRALLVSLTGPDRNDTMDIFVCALWHEADVALAAVGECRTGPNRRGRRTR